MFYAIQKRNIWNHNTLVSDDIFPMMKAKFYLNISDSLFGYHGHAYSVNNNIVKKARNKLAISFN